MLLADHSHRFPGASKARVGYGSGRMFAADEEADEEWSTTESVKMPDTSV